MFSYVVFENLGVFFKIITILFLYDAISDPILFSSVSQPPFNTILLSHCFEFLYNVLLILSILAPIVHYFYHFMLTTITIAKTASL